MHAANSRCRSLTRWGLGSSCQRVSRNPLPLNGPVSDFDSELEIKIINTRDSTITNLLRIKDLPKPPKHLSFHPSGSYLAVSCTDGIVYVYNISTEEPTLIKKYDGLIRRLEADDEKSSKAIWHPDGRAFAIPTATRDVQVVSRDDGEKQRTFSGGHMGDITALAWSPNGGMLATSASDRKIVLWDSRTQKTIARSAKLINTVSLVLTMTQIRLLRGHQFRLASSRQHFLVCDF